MLLADLPARLRSVHAAVADAGSSFARKDGLAMASHVALSLVIALFPFLICVAALARCSPISENRVRRPASALAHALVLLPLAIPLRGLLRRLLLGDGRAVAGRLRGKSRGGKEREQGKGEDAQHVGRSLVEAPRC